MASSARIEELKKKFDENPRRYFAPLANEYRKAGDLEAAIAICRTHLPQQPGHMSGHIVFGQTLYEAGQLEEAGTIFQTALELDPENLIALRHLGDIARGLGDDSAARTWYSRVLEADPRNEEISGLLASLEGGAPARASSTAEIVPPDAPAIGGSATQLLDASDLRELDEPATAGSETGLHDVASWGDRVPEAAPSASLDHEPIPETTDTWAIPTRPSEEPAAAATPEPAASAVPQGEEPRELELPSTPAAMPRVSGESILTPEPDAAGIAPLPGFEATEFQTPPAAEVPGTLAGLEGMADWATKGDELPPAPPAPPAPAAAQAAPAPEPAPEPAQGVPIVTETMAELLLSQGHRQQALAVYRQLVEQRPGDEVLRYRLAELEAQGGPTMRQLLGAIAAWRPGQPAADPMGAEPWVQQDAAPDAPTPDWDAVAAAPAPEAPAPEAPAWEAGTPSRAPADDGQFAPSFPTPPAPEAPTPAPEPVEPPAPEPIPEPPEPPAPEPTPARSSGAFVVDESYVPTEGVAASPAAAEPQEPEPASAPSMNGAQGHEAPAPRGGSIDRLFGGMPASEGDVRAAHALAAAFGSAPAAATEEESGIKGEPARRASTDFSLDQIFRPGGGGAPKPSEGRGFSFDQFFGSPGGGAKTAPAAEEPRQRGDDSEDIQQFNSWLQGLKKR